MKYTLINERVIYNENNNIYYEGTLEDVKEYLKENNLIFIRISNFSNSVYYK